MSFYAASIDNHLILESKHQGYRHILHESSIMVFSYFCSSFIILNLVLDSCTNNKKSLILSIDWFVKKVIYFSFMIKLNAMTWYYCFYRLFYLTCYLPRVLHKFEEIKKSYKFIVYSAITWCYFRLSKTLCNILCQIL